MWADMLRDIKELWFPGVVTFFAGLGTVALVFGVVLAMCSGVLAPLAIAMKYLGFSF